MEPGVKEMGLGVKVRVMEASILILAFLTGGTRAGSCTPPSLAHGSVSTEGGGDAWVYSFSCHPGFILAGSRRVKCRGGTWSNGGAAPVCAAMGKCDPSLLPHVNHAEVRPYNAKVFRNSVYKYHCAPGFRMHNNPQVHCTTGGWNLRKLPVCSRAGCDERLVSFIHNGEARRRARGGVYVFKCSPGAELAGVTTVVCDGTSWDHPAPQCLSPAPPPSLTLGVGGVLATSATAGDHLTLTCESAGGAPPPTLLLTLGGTALAAPATSSTSASLTAAPSHNTMVAACSATNSAMEQPAITEIVLNVRFGPERVSIGGPATLEQGQGGGFTCITSPSNPVPEVAWAAAGPGGEHLEHLEGLLQASPTSPPTWSGSGWEAESAVTIHPGSGLTSILLSCTATNPATHLTATATHLLRLQFAPEQVSITGPTSARAGALLHLSCSSSPSVPATNLTWTISGGEEEEEEVEVEVEQLADGSFITYSRITVQAGVGPGLSATCYGHHLVLGGDAVARLHQVELSTPPGVPTISGVRPHSALQTLNCSTSSGRPPAVLAWYRGQEMMESHYTVEGDTVSAVIEFYPSHTTEEELTCEASNAALTEPVRNSITIQASTTTTSTSTSSTTSSTTSEATSPWVRGILTPHHPSEAPTPPEPSGTEDEEEYDYSDEDEDYTDYNFNEIEEDTENLNDETDTFDGTVITNNSVHQSFNDIENATNDSSNKEKIEDEDATDEFGDDDAAREEEDAAEDAEEKEAVAEDAEEEGEEHEEVVLTSEEGGGGSVGGTSEEPGSGDSTESAVEVESAKPPRTEPRSSSSSSSPLCSSSLLLPLLTTLLLGTVRR